MYSNEMIKYIGDSVLNSQTVKILQHSKSFYYQNNYGIRYSVIKQNGDTVFFRNATTQHSWQVLYNFAATAGQSWTTTVSDTHSWSAVTIYTITVDSVITTGVNGFNLRTLYVKYKVNTPAPYSIPDMPAQITERFGCHYFLFNYKPVPFSTDQDQSMSVLCYKDNTFGTKLFTDKPCNYEAYMSIEENSQAGGSFHIFPNPGNGQFRLSIPNSLAGSDLEIKVLDLSGRRVKQMKPDAGSLSPSIDLRELETGAYTIQVAQGGQIRYNGKIIKQD